MNEYMCITYILVGWSVGCLVFDSCPPPPNHQPTGPTTQSNKQGEVWLSSGVVFEGTVTVTNGSKEPKVLPKGVYKDATVDLTSACVRMILYMYIIYA